MNSQVVDFYTNSNVLITGGTGFLGKVLTQKLLRTCLNIQGVYLIVRKKRDISANQRYNEIFQDALFETLQREQPDFLKKIHLFEGDCSLPNLGLSKSSVNLLTEKITVVFHCAATLNFNEALTVAVATNIRSLQELLQLSYRMVNLKAFIYVSTAYSNCTQKLIEERFYDPPIQPDILMKLVDELSETKLISITERLFQPWPNTYCYTKAVAENLLLQERKNLPVAIFRPTILSSTYTEPIPGWTSNVYSANGVLYAVSQGLLRVIKADSQATVDMVPVDMAANALISSAWETNHTHETSKDDLTPINIYNYSTGLNKNYYLTDAVNITRSYPYLFSKRALCYPFLILTRSSLLFNMCWFFLQTIPAHLIDLILRMRGEKKRMVKLNSRINEFMNVLNYFLRKQTDIKHENVNRLWKRLNLNDQELFPFNIELWDKNMYNEHFAAGLQLYISKEPLGDSQKCLNYYKRLKMLHYSCIGFGITVITCLFYKICVILV